MMGTKEILLKIYQFLESRFNTGDLRKLVRKYDTITEPKEIQSVSKIEVLLFNSGEVTAVINSSFPVPPLTQFTQSSYEGYSLSADISITFDTTNSFNLNIGAGTLTRVNSIVTKYGNKPRQD